MDNLTQATKDLIERVKVNYQEYLSWQNEPKIHSRETISFVAFAYEKLRNFVDYQEEHLLRRRAVTRALNRRLLFPQTPEEMASGMIMELIRSRYLPNNVLPQRKIDDVAKIILRHQKLMAEVPSLKETLTLVCGREIEEYLTLDDEFALVLFTYAVFKEKLLVKNDQLLFVAVEEALSRPDEETIRYHLLKIMVSNWNDPQEFVRVNNEISNLLGSSEKEMLVRRIRKSIAPFVMMRDLISQHNNDLESVLADSQILEKTITQVASSRYRKASANLKTSAIQSFIYIFLTKMLFAFVIEAPYDLYIQGHVKMLPIMINLLFPPFFMVLTTQTVSIPGAKNTQKIVFDLKRAVYANGAIVPEVGIDLFSGLRPSLSALFNIFYLMTFVIIFGGVIYLLNSLQFSIVSMAIFFFFVSTVAFFAFRIRRNFQDLTITEEKEGLITGLFNFISYPFIRLGLVFSQTLSHFNVFILILDLLIEAPLKTLLELIEEWFAFIKRKQEEIL